MSIENTFERIAIALEQLVVLASDSAVKKPKPERPKTEAPSTEVPTTGAKVYNPPAKTEITWAEVSKKLFKLLGEIKTAKGLDKAKEISAALAAKYSNGAPPSVGNTDPTSYGEFMADIEAHEADFKKG